MIGSETFIMVAFMCKENNTPFSFASFIWSSRKVVKAVLLMKVASITSSASRGNFSFRTVIFWKWPTNSILASVALAMVVDFSLEKKSPLLMDATCVLESGLHAAILCGFFLAYSFTATAALRSEFPSLKTGFTALPRTFAYLVLISFSASFFGSSG